MQGIYIHIPFCQQACHYCDFHFSTLLKYKEPFVKALIKEIELSPELTGQEITTLYFGGGTPSVLSESELTEILTAIKGKVKFSESIEITLECNPEDISESRLQFYKALGVNRLSLGVQSFHEKLLQLSNRAHSSEQSLTSVRLIKKAGFVNFSADLIYGLPQSNLHILKSDLKTLTEMGVPHISVYGMTFEQGTVFGKWLKKGKIQGVEEDLEAEMFEYIMDYLDEKGYVQYEISNFGKPEFFSRHNSSYWWGKPYLGLGPGAHSFDGVSRSKSVPD